MGALTGLRDDRSSRFLGKTVGARKFLSSLNLEVLLVVLVLLTGAAVLYQDEILGQEIAYTPIGGPAFEQYWYGDESAGGASRVEPDPQRPLAWTCSLETTHQYPYCGYGLLFDVRNVGRGQDLSNFHTVRLSFDYEGPAETLRLDLKNRMVRPGGRPEETLDKVNGVEFTIAAGRQTVDLALSDFRVANWWLVENRLPPELSHPQYDNVVALEMQTGNGASPGRHRLAIERIAFRGALLTTKQWYGGIFACWLVILGLILVLRRRQARRLQRDEAVRWRKTLDTIPQMVWSTAPGSDEYFNGRWTEFTGASVGNPGGLRHADLIHPDDQATAIARWKQCLDTGEAFEAEYRMKHRSGDYRHVLSRGFPERDELGEVVRWYGTCTDIHDRVLAQQDLWRSQHFTRQLIEASPDGILVIDDEGIIVFANEAARRDMGAHSRSELTGKAWLSLVPPDVRRAAQEALSSGEGEEGRRHFTAERLSTCGPESWWDVIVAPLAAAQRSERFLVISRNISHQKIAEQKAQWSAMHDALTELPNRILLQQELDLLSAGGSAGFAVLILDVDEFKKINDTLGHDAGDFLLCAFADKLKEAARPDDLVARLGGDEFAIILRDVDRERDVRRVADRIFASLREPIVHQGKVVDCNTSIGASLFPRDGRNKVELLKNADVALYVAKSSGRRNLKIFSADMRSDVELRRGMIARGRRALEEDTILPYYQPKIELATGRIAGFEALLRWRHPQRGIQTPETIKAAFEDLSLAAEISDRMIERLIRDVGEWLERGHAFDHVAFNAAAAELRAGDFAERLLERLERADVPTRCIQMEVTETVFVGRGAEHVERTLRTLSENGIRISLDDFGTGYASLSHLKAFPVDLLKIDQSFVRHLQTNAEDGAIVDAVIGLGRSLKIDVIAEGIETKAQHDTLLALGCKYGQGFLYSTPMAAGDVGRFCAGGPPRSTAAAAAA